MNVVSVMTIDAMYDNVNGITVTATVTMTIAKIVDTAVDAGQVRFITRPKSRTMRAKRKKNVQVRELTERRCPNEQRARE
jgi:hypothetical protein